MANPTNKQELLERLNADRQEWDSLLGQVGEPRMTLSGATGNWSVQDTVAHLTAWESRIVAWLEAAQAGTWPQPAAWPTNLTEDQENDWIYKANRGRSLSDILNESRQVHNRVVELVQATPEEQLLDSQRYEWLRGNSLLGSMAGNSYEHYHEHAQVIRNWLGQLEQPVSEKG